MKKVFLAIAAAFSMSAMAQTADTIRVNVNGNEIIILTTDVTKLSSTDYNAIIKKVTEETEKILARQKADLNRVDTRLENGELTQEDATAERNEINKRTAEEMKKLNELITAWIDSKPENTENAEDVETWVKQWEDNAEAYDENPDRIVVKDKKSTTIVIDDDGIRVEDGGDSWIERRKHKQLRTYTQFEIDWGWNNFFDENGMVRDNDWELNHWNSAVFGFGWAGKTRLGNDNSKFYIRYGAQFNWNNLRFRGSKILVKTENPAGVAISNDSDNNYRISRFRQVHLDVPVMFQFDASKKGVDNSFTLGLGGYGGVRIGTQNRLRYDDFNGDNVKNIISNNFFGNPFRYGVVAQVGFGAFKITGKYDVSTLFRQDRITPNYQLGSIAFGFAIGD